MEASKGIARYYCRYALITHSKHGSSVECVANARWVQVPIDASVPYLIVLHWHLRCGLQYRLPKLAKVQCAIRRGSYD
jgi:hypothetical protein